jgi:hypothetical protein
MGKDFSQNEHHERHQETWPGIKRWCGVYAFGKIWIIQNIRLVALSCELLKCSSPPCSDACRLAQGRDALIRWRALFEPFDKTQDRLRELVRPPQSGVRPLP